MKRQHLMPFGAEALAAGGVRFRLWAPGVAALRLRLDEAQEMPMAAAGGGWFELTVAAAGAGSRYCFRLPDGLLVPDPASRCNPDGVHGSSKVVVPTDFDWPDGDWRGRPWEEAVIYELHVGSFTPAGNFAGVEQRLDHLADLGVSALEIMPVAAAPGRAGWGYDGVLAFAPQAAYGRPEDFKRLIAAAHERGLMVFLDVVYNHFGPEGNYLHTYAPTFFNRQHATPWGAAINFAGEGSRTVRDFFLHNALYWLEEYHLDGLRLDAIHALHDDSSPDIVEELAAAVGSGPGRERHLHLLLENVRNEARYLGRDASGRPRQCTAQWNDDFHHALHVLSTGETDGYYRDFAAEPLRLLGRCLGEGFAFQGEISPCHDGKPRGEASRHLPPAAFVNFLQTHDQVGNRPFGERLCHLASPAAQKALTALLLLAPQPPLLFMGEEFAAAQPFLFFCDFGSDLADAVSEGRRREFARCAHFTDPAARQRIPDPNAPATFAACVLDWSARARAPHRTTLEHHRRLLQLRRQWIAPRLAGMKHGAAQVARFAERALRVRWRLGDGSRLSLLANLGEQAVAATPEAGTPIFTTHPIDAAGRLPPWSVAWHLQADESA